ncbi:hypothetical protein BCR37DRAFT_395291 [Protomyces lactucae-debilis]|uniref:Uncharacterized protein n=1 Tax=Protomyces lactucae-debilis TaxID=2754530 RepID=A0A1Y2EXZ5_PROLT|nr:uncharacterized protein BCR37DRAFT_395291 [Protomyces lactucae-debilis]ORY76357.1 hypothetical protein BCR37DRAFT_395291 [Protomyces lactucae-debilis]
MRERGMPHHLALEASAFQATERGTILAIPKHTNLCHTELLEDLFLEAQHTFGPPTPAASTRHHYSSHAAGHQSVAAVTATANGLPNESEEYMLNAFDLSKKVPEHEHEWRRIRGLVKGLVHGVLKHCSMDLVAKSIRWHILLGVRRQGAVQLLCETMETDVAPASPPIAADDANGNEHELMLNLLAAEMGKLT